MLNFLMCASFIPLVPAACPASALHPPGMTRDAKWELRRARLSPNLAKPSVTASCARTSQRVQRPKANPCSEHLAVQSQKGQLEATFPLCLRLSAAGYGFGSTTTRSTRRKEETAWQ